MGGDDVVEVLSLLHSVPQLVPGALQHLHKRQERPFNNNTSSQHSSHDSGNYFYRRNHFIY